MMDVTKNNQKISVRFITLGCPKNLVDSEVMLGLLNKDHFVIFPEDVPSDVGVVNTCGFVEDAKKESIDAILSLAEEKKKGRLKYLVVSGCLSQRYKEELPKLLPEVDVFIGTGDFSRLSQIILEKMKGKKKRQYIRIPEELPTALMPRAISTPFYTRYVKISEGCSHSCSFCTIPLMRGGLNSRTSDDIVNEIQGGVDQGVKEFNLIAQDLNEYGRDLAKRDSLQHLLSKLAGLRGDFWIRLLYMYPLQFPDKLIQLISEHPHICPYVDIPLQHIDDKILKSMRRGSSASYIHRLLNNLRKKIPDIVLRTTFITGYPGETEEAFNRLLLFIRDTEFDRVGVFTYSDEEGTHADTLPNKVPKEVKEERRHLLMQTQQEISLKKNKALIGKTLKVLHEGPSEDLHYAGVGRFYGQAPEIDGEVLIKNGDSVIGQFVHVKITKALEYDLVGEIS